MASGDRFTVIIVIRTHRAECSGFFKSDPERLEVESAHLARCDVRVGSGLAVTASYRNAVNCEMLDGGHKFAGLQGFYHIPSQFSYKERILPIAFDSPSPPRVLTYVKYGRVYVGVTQSIGLGSFRLPYPAYEIAVPSGSLTALGREICGPVVTQSAYALVCKINRDAESCLLDEPPLNLMLRIDVSSIWIGILRTGLPYSVMLFVDVAYAVLPHPVPPGISRQIVLKDAAAAVEGSHLAGLFFDCHLRKQICNSFFDRGSGVLVNVHTAVLVKIYPSLAVNAPCAEFGRLRDNCDKQCD